MYITIMTFITNAMIENPKENACILARQGAENKGKGKDDAHEQDHFSVPRQSFGGYAGHGSDGDGGSPQCLCRSHHSG